MDWKKAKSILIFSFLILNIVLAVVLYNDLKLEEISNQIITNTSKILEKNDVHIELPIPKYAGKNYILQYEEKPLDRKNIAAILLGNNYATTDNNSYNNGSMSLVFDSNSGFDFFDTGNNKVLTSDSEADVDKYLKRLSGELGLPFKEFRRDGYYQKIKADTVTRVVYKGEYKGYAVFDNYIAVEVSKTAVKRIKYHYNKPISIMVDDDTYVIPVYEILITKMTNYPGTTIINVDKGFKGYTQTKTLFEDLSWRITTDDGEEYYFNARNGVQME